jgi:hypothetical protein
VALPASFGQVLWINGRLGIGRRQDVVHTVAA